MRYFWLNRFKQDDQILHGTVTGTAIHTANLLADSLFYTFQSLFNGFYIRNRVDSCFHGDHHKITMTLAANTELTHILILTGKVTVIQIHGTDVGAAFPQGFGYELKVFASTGGKKFFTVNLLIEEELIFTVLFDII